MKGVEKVMERRDNKHEGNKWKGGKINVKYRRFRQFTRIHRLHFYFNVLSHHFRKKNWAFTRVRVCGTTGLPTEWI